jgi:hypothetical protein
MAHFFFDESGYDSGESPYAMLGGAAIEDRELWSLVKDIRSAEVKHFGIPYSSGQRELKAKKLLNRRIGTSSSLNVVGIGPAKFCRSCSSFIAI